jgi:hypothetical protein
MKILSVAIGIILILTSSAVKAQTADEVIEKHLAAIGGRTLLNSIKSQVVESSINVMGSDLNSTTTLLVGKGFKSVASFSGQEIIQSITPTSGWMINPLAGQLDPAPMPEDQLKAALPALSIGGTLSNYKENGGKAEFSGKVETDGVTTYKIKLTDNDKKESFYFIDLANYYLVRVEAAFNFKGQESKVFSTFSNYKKTSIGLVIPYTTVRNQGFEMTITVNKVEFNTPVDPKIFEMPK